MFTAGDYVQTSRQIENYIKYLRSSISDLKENIASTKNKIKANFQGHNDNLMRREKALISQADRIGSERLNKLGCQLQNLYVTKAELERNSCNTAVINKIQDLVSRIYVVDKAPGISFFGTSCLATVISSHGNIISEGILCQNSCTKPQIDVDNVEVAPIDVLEIPKGDNSFWLVPQKKSCCQDSCSKTIKMLPCNSAQDRCQKRRTGTNDSRTQSFSSCCSSSGESFEILGYSSCSENLSEWVASDKVDFAELSNAISVNTPRSAPSLADTSAWLSKESSMDESLACSNSSIFPAYFFNTGLDYWLQTPVSYSVNDETDLSEKLASLAVRFDGDDGKELDQAEVVALVCCQQSGTRCDAETNTVCKTFAECRRQSNQCASRLVETATNLCSPDVAAWLSHQTGLLPLENLQELNGQQEVTVPAYLQQLRKIRCSDLSLWITDAQAKTAPKKQKEITTSESSQWLVETESSSDLDLFAGWKRRWQSTGDEDAKKENIWLASANDLEISEVEPDELEFFQSHPSARKITKIANLLLNDEISTEAMMEMIPRYPYQQSPQLHQPPLAPTLVKTGKAEQVSREDAVY